MSVPIALAVKGAFTHRTTPAFGVRVAMVAHAVARLELLAAVGARVRDVLVVLVHVVA